MRRVLLIVAVLCAARPGAAAAKPKFPYVAYIAADQTALRSGPGEEHYPTDRLDRGTKECAFALFPQTDGRTSG